jgi:hypothetical protein
MMSGNASEPDYETHFMGLLLISMQSGNEQN